MLLGLPEAILIRSLLPSSYGDIPCDQFYKPALLNMGEGVDSKVRTLTRTYKKQPRVKVQHHYLAAMEGRNGECN